MYVCDLIRHSYASGNRIHMSDSMNFRRFRFDLAGDPFRACMLCAQQVTNGDVIALVRAHTHSTLMSAPRGRLKGRVLHIKVGRFAANSCDPLNVCDARTVMCRMLLSGRAAVFVRPVRSTSAQVSE